MEAHYIGIDIGSTATKLAALSGERALLGTTVVPFGTGTQADQLALETFYRNSRLSPSDCVRTIATGYGRLIFRGADAQVSEISCHAKGRHHFLPQARTIIDVGGQDTKVIIVQNGMVSDFQMNDKCSAGTGKFLEIMANRLGVTINELFDMAAAGEVIPISSLCTVFAESEVINYIGEGKKREDIAAGVVDSVANKVVQLAQKKELGDRVILTGGLSHSIYFTGILSDKLDQKVESEEFGRFAGAYGAALLAREKKDKRR